MSYNVKIEIPAERVYAMFVGAFEGGSNYWLHSAELESGTPHKIPDLVWWGEQSVFENDYSIAVKFDDPGEEEGDNKGRLFITPSIVTMGLQTMATQCAQHFANMLTKNDDAETADVFMQCVVFGDVVYG